MITKSLHQISGAFPHCPAHPKPFRLNNNVGNSFVYKIIPCHYPLYDSMSYDLDPSIQLLKMYLPPKKNSRSALRL